MTPFQRTKLGSYKYSARSNDPGYLLNNPAYFNEQGLIIYFINRIIKEEPTGLALLLRLLAFLFRLFSGPEAECLQTVPAGINPSTITSSYIGRKNDFAKPEVFIVPITHGHHLPCQVLLLQGGQNYCILMLHYVTLRYFVTLVLPVSSFNLCGCVSGTSAGNSPGKDPWPIFYPGLILSTTPLILLDQPLFLFSRSNCRHFFPNHRRVLKPVLQFTQIHNSGVNLTHYFFEPNSPQERSLI